MLDCTFNTQNSLLLNQHNGDDAPQDLLIELLVRHSNSNKRRKISFEIPSEWEQIIWANLGQLKELVFG